MFFLQLEAPSLLRIIISGGPTMLLAIVLTIWWLVLLVRACRRPASLAKGVVFLAFPVAYGLIVFGRVLLFWHGMFRELGLRGQPDPMVYSEMGLVFTRSSWVVFAMAFVSFLVAAGFIWKGVEAEQRWRRMATEKNRGPS